MHIFVCNKINCLSFTAFKNFKLELMPGNVSIYTNQSISQRMQIHILIRKKNSYTCSVNDSPWIKITKITIIIASFCIDQFTRVCSGSLRKRKNKQFCVQEFSADREFHELTRQGGKLGVL